MSKSWSDMIKKNVVVPPVQQETKVQSSKFENWKPMFPDIPKKVDECVIQFKLSNNRIIDKLCIGSNCYYELHVNNKFYADGGMRCSPGKLLRDTFTFDAPINSQNICVLLHYVSYKNSVWYRMLFPDSFFNDYDENNVWQSNEYSTIKFGSKISSQLMRQNIMTNNQMCKNMPLVKVPCSWSYIDPNIKFNYPTQVFKNKELQQQKFGRIVKFPKFEQKSCSSNYTGGIIDNLNNFVAKEDENLLEILHNICDRNVVYYTIDLKQNGLYKLQVKTDAQLVVYYSEVSEFENAWNTENRKKVWLADMFCQNQNSATHIEWRGCRYLHVLTTNNSNFEITAIRKEYCFEWNEHKCDNQKLQTIYDACKRNLIACVDGGIVDTCWRERAQWVGDAYISTKILKKMCSSNSSFPIIKNVLTQIADSYDKTTGMVQGAYPIKKKDKVNFLMPTYHLLWIMSVIEHSDIVPELMPVVIESMKFWEANYVNKMSCLVTSSPGWNFVDWAGEDASGRSFDGQPNCFVNILYMHACECLKLKTIVSKTSIDKTFYIPELNQYSLYSTSPASIQATSIAICFMETEDKCKETFYTCANQSNFVKSHTMYYGYYVAKALTENKPLQRKYITDKYFTCANTYSTIIEKIDPESSMAHGWSIGVAEFL